MWPHFVTDLVYNLFNEDLYSLSFFFTPLLVSKHPNPRMLTPIHSRFGSGQSSTCVRCHTAFLTKIMLLYLRHARNWNLVNSGLQVSSFLSGIIFLSNCVLGFMSTDSLSLIAECSLLIYESDCGISILKFNFFCDGLVIELYFQMDNSTELYSIRDLICVICSKFYTSGFWSCSFSISRIYHRTLSQTLGNVGLSFFIEKPMTPRSWC